MKRCTVEHLNFTT